MQKTDYNVYQEAPEHYDAALDPDFIQRNFLPVKEKAAQRLPQSGGRLLDVCCGTGALAELLKDLPFAQYLGVDVNQPFLSRAGERTAGDARYAYQSMNLLADEISGEFDLILWINAYHHFEDRHKSTVLKKIRGAMANGGTLLVSEVPVASYDTAGEYRQALTEYYRKRISWMMDHEPMPPEKIRSWENGLELALRGEEEFKVDYEYMARDFAAQGLAIQEEIRIWPDEDLFGPQKVGEYLFVLAAAG